MINLLEETLTVLKRHNKTYEDIVWVGSEDGYIDLEEFKKIANVYYDNGYGSTEIPTDLIIVGKDFFMIRGEYDGSEWWEYYSKDMFKKPKKQLLITRLCGGMWSKLNEMN